MVSKVVLGAAKDGTPGLRVSPVTTAGTSRTHPGTELHLGSQDLIRLAAFASTRGFVVSSLTVSDSHLVPLPQDDQATISDEMVELLTAYGTQELETALRNEYEGLYIVGVQLIEVASGMRISIRRRGFVETAIVREAEALLRSAWRELRLS